jgi:hypothetical protein
VQIPCRFSQPQFFIRTLRHINILCRKPLEFEK